MITSFQNSTVRFNLGKEIGLEGKNSQVFIGHDKHLNAQVAIKRIELNQATKKPLDDYFVEAQTLYMSSHPNVVQILYASFDDDYVYLVMPYYENGSLKQLLKNRHLTAREIIQYSINFMNGLYNIHSKGLIHFDIKPDNILLSERKEALLSDFGLAKLVDSDGVASPDQLYPRTLPPEYLQELTKPEEDRDMKFDRRYDIYQVGVTLYRLCVGDDRYYNEFNKHIVDGKINWAQLYRNQRDECFLNLDDYPPHIPKQLQATIKKCLRFSPENRYNSVFSIINALSDIQEKILDWQYSFDQENEYWEKTDCENRLFKLQVNKVSNESLATKTINSNTTKIKEYCLKSIEKRQILNFLERY